MFEIEVPGKVLESAPIKNKCFTGMVRFGANFMNVTPLINKLPKLYSEEIAELVRHWEIMSKESFSLPAKKKYFKLLKVFKTS